ncbi:retrotransposon protein, putative, ty1-copia subclass [Tanacetum coccineum]
MSASSSQDEIPPLPPPPPSSQTPTQQTPHTVSTIKLTILKKGEYDILAMKMEHYLAHTDYLIWEVIQNGNGLVSITTDTQGQIKVLLPRTAEEIMMDAKEMWDAINLGFGGNDESMKMARSSKALLSQLEIHGAGVSTEDANQKFLRSLPSAWSQRGDIKKALPAHSSSPQNVAFVSENTSSTNEVSTAYSVPNLSGQNSKYEQTSSYYNTCNHSSCPRNWIMRLGNRLMNYDLEENRLKWQVSMRLFAMRNVDKGKSKTTGGGCMEFWKQQMGAELDRRSDSTTLEHAMKVNTVKPTVNRDYPHRALKNKGIVDSRCFRHMTGNKVYLAKFQDFNGGPVAFEDSIWFISLTAFSCNSLMNKEILQTSRNTNPRVSTSTGVAHKTNVSRPQPRSNQMKDKVVPNTSHVKFKKTEVEEHPRISSISNQTKSVTACNDSLNSRTSNVNAVCATCGKCVFNSNHDACVSKFLKDVNARTKKPNVVPISTRKPKSQANKSVATPHKKTVASESTITNSKSYYRMLYKKTNKAWKWWIAQQCPSAYTWVPKTKRKWVPKVRNESVTKKIVQLILFIVDSGCTKHMTGNLSLLCNFVEKYLGTVRFGNDQFAPILGYGDLVQGNISIERVYYVEGLNHNLFSVGQFCDADLEVAFRKSTCFVRDLQGNDLLTGNRGTDLYTISLQETSSSAPICLMAKASPTQAWLWHRRLSHLNFDYINLLSKKDVVIGLPKLKYVKDQLCSSCEVSKAKRSSFKSKTVPSSKGRLNLLHMDLCGPMRVASINGKKYILVIVDDYSRYTWTLFLRSKDETPEVLKDFLTMIQRNLQAPVISVRTDRGTEFLNKTLNAFFKEEGIEHQTSTPRTPEQNGVVERRNRTLVEAARTMLSASKLPLFFWAEAIATACYTQNRSIIIPTHEKTAYHIINDRKPSIKHLHIFGCTCYLTRDGENLDKMKEKGDSCILVGYSTQSKGYRVYNKRTRLIVESIHLRFDEFKEMVETSVANDTSGLVPQRQKASDYDNPDPAPELQNVFPSADTTVPSQQELDLLFGPLYDEFFNDGTSRVNKSSSPTDNSAPQDTNPSTNIHPTSEPTTPTNVHAEENNDDQAEFTNPFCTPVQEAAESSSPSWKSFISLTDSISGNSLTNHLARQVIDSKKHLLRLLRLEAVRSLSHMLAHKSFPIYQMDVKTAFLNGPFKRGGLCCTTDGFVDPDHPDKVYRLRKALYGLKQSPEPDPTIPTRYFYQIRPRHLRDSEKHGMEKVQSIVTPLLRNLNKCILEVGEPVDQTDYRSKIGSLMYLTSSRPDIVQAVCYCARYQARPTEKHLKELFQMPIMPVALILAKALLEEYRFLVNKYSQLDVKKQDLKQAMHQQG